MNATTVKLWTLSSCKGVRHVVGSQLDAIDAAKIMDATLRPSLGVDIRDANGELVANVDGGVVEDLIGYLFGAPEEEPTCMSCGQLVDAISLRCMSCES